jgi:hypothetical protein
MTTKLDELRCIEAQIEEAISLHQRANKEPYGECAQYEAIHIGSVLREGLVHCQLLRRMIEDMSRPACTCHKKF